VTVELSEGQTFGGYHIIELVGSGGMGLVYRAEQRILGRIVALKVIRPEIAESGDYRSRFLREARFAASINHPNVVSVFDAGEQDGRLYLTMQWVDGTDLGTLIDREQRLAPERAVLIGVQLAEALQAVHDAGLVHRDVKPANVLVRDIGGRDHAYLTDFGIAKAPSAQDSLTRTGWVIGTPAYLSPEQIRGQQPGPRSDLYALGCVIFEALTGQPPFTGDNDLAARWAQASSPPPLASSVCPALGSRYDAFLARALAMDPDDRFASGTAFAEALEAAHAGRLADPPPAPAIGYAPTQRKPSPSAPPPAVPGTRHETAIDAAGTPDTAVPRPARPRPASSGPRPAAVSAGPAAALAGDRGGTGPSRPGARRRASGVLRAGQLIAVVGGLVFIASVTVLTRYTNNGTGWKSLWQATHGDLASPLYQADFWIPAGLAAAGLVFTAISAGTRSRLAMVGTALASLGLIAYTLHIPSTGASPGFQPYGSSYWISLGAAILMVIGAAVGLAARTRAPDPHRSPHATRHDPVR
jgi:serine/threonine protein kinase